MEDLLNAIPKNSYRQLQLVDRCDRCGAQAFARAVKMIDDKELELLFCGHEFNEVQPHLIAEGFLLQDDRHLINMQSTEYEA